MQFPFYNQFDVKDCGPSSLRMIAKYYGRTYSLEQVRALSHVTREGTSMLGLSDAAENMGFRSRGVRLTWEQLSNEVQLPCIVHWNQNHFVVVHSITRKGLFFRQGSKHEEIIGVADPAHGLLTYSRSEFLKHWSVNNLEGVALLLEPSATFYQEDPGEIKVSHYSYLLNYLRPYRKFIIQLLLGMLTGSFVSMIFPFLTQSIVDYGIGNSDLNFIWMVLMAQLILTFGQAANEMIRNQITLHVTTRVSISLISDFLIKLMRLPISFFDSRMIGDIMQRMGDHSRIQNFLTTSLVNILFASITLLIYTVIMALYHPGILVVFLIGSLTYIGWVLLFLRKRRELDYKRFQQASANQSNIVQLITGMQDIKLNNCEKQKRWEWERIQAKLYKINIRGLLLNQNQFVGGTFINQTKDIIISFLTARAVVTGQMTLGMMMAVQYIIGQLNTPIQLFIGFVQSAQDAKISLERLGEINDKKDEEDPQQDRIREVPEGKDIVLRNVAFQYEGPSSPRVLNGINLEIPANKVTAIVGTSGSGKSTLVKLMLGFYQPVEGIVTLGGISLDRFNQQEWRQKCGVVLQEGFIFSDTIAGNIGIGDQTPDRIKIENAVATSNIKTFIESLPLNYSTKIGSDGHGLSTGQKQRILIARSVYKDPGYIFFDEATNALDAGNERIIMGNLKQFFKDRTVVVVAHRLSTVKDADQIVVLEAGEIVETGTHNELVEKRGTYYHLVKDQLELGN